MVEYVVVDEEEYAEDLLDQLEMEIVELQRKLSEKAEMREDDEAKWKYAMGKDLYEFLERHPEIPLMALCRRVCEGWEWSDDPRYKPNTLRGYYYFYKYWRDYEKYVKLMWWVEVNKSGGIVECLASSTPREKIEKLKEELEIDKSLDELEEEFTQHIEPYKDCLHVKPGNGIKYSHAFLLAHHRVPYHKVPYYVSLSREGYGYKALERKVREYKYSDKLNPCIVCGEHVKNRELGVTAASVRLHYKCARQLLEEGSIDRLAYEHYFEGKKMRKDR